MMRSLTSVAAADPGAGVVLRGRPLEETLAMLASNGALGRGGVNIISLEPIAERLGERWDRKRDDVWRQVETLLRRQFQPDDLIVRLDALNILIAQPGKERMSAQSMCVRAAAELMTFFIGEGPAESLRIRVVEGIDEQALVAKSVPLHHIEAMMLADSGEVGKPARAKSTPILTRLGRNLTTAVSLEPLWSMQGKPRIIGHQAKVKLSDGDTGRTLDSEERRRLQPGELADLDVSTLKTSLEMRAASPRLLGGLIIPVSYLTLTNSSTRYQVLQELQRLEPAERRSFGWEIVDLEDGIPAGRLAEMVGIARRQCRGVICRLDLSAANAEKAHGAGATLSVAAPDTPHTELTMFRLEPLVLAAAKHARAVMLHDVPAELMPVASFIGASHCTVSPRTRP